jgi:hypothetical protein
VRGRQSWRGGIVLDAGWYRSDASANYLGTYTFDNMDAYLANPPEQLHATDRRPKICRSGICSSAYIRTTFARGRISR